MRLKCVPRSNGRAKVWVKDAFAHLKGAFICLMYGCPKILPFIPTTGMKVHPHFYIVLINTLSFVFFSLFPTTTYLSLFLSGISIVLLVTCLLRDKV